MISLTETVALLTQAITSSASSNLLVVQSELLTTPDGGLPVSKSEPLDQCAPGNPLVNQNKPLNLTAVSSLPVDQNKPLIGETKTLGLTTPSNLLVDYSELNVAPPVNNPLVDKSEPLAITHIVSPLIDQSEPLGSEGEPLAITTGGSLLIDRSELLTVSTSIPLVDHSEIDDALPASNSPENDSEPPGSLLVDEGKLLDKSDRRNQTSDVRPPIIQSELPTTSNDGIPLVDQSESPVNTRASSLLVDQSESQAVDSSSLLVDEGELLEQTVAAYLDTTKSADEPKSELNRQQLADLFKVSIEAVRLRENKGTLKEWGWEPVPKSIRPKLYRKI